MSVFYLLIGSNIFLKVVLFISLIGNPHLFANFMYIFKLYGKMITKQLKSNKQFLTNTDNSSLDFKISGCKDSIFF